MHPTPLILRRLFPSFVNSAPRAAALALALAGLDATAAPAAPDYFGAKLPGSNAEIFAPGVVSRPDRFEARIAFSPDGQECYLTETDATFSQPRILVARRNQDGWTDFLPVPFAARFKVCHEPFLSDDNRKLYFTADGDEAVAGNRRDLWVVERAGAGWGEPVRLPAPINSAAAEFFFNQSSDGTIVFASDRPGGLGAFDLYYVEKTATGVAQAVNFGPVLNTPGPEFDPCLSPDGRFIVFAGAREGRPNLDLYVSFRDEGKKWTTPVPLPGSVNTDANEYAPTLTRDGRYLFFVRHDGKQSDLYWLATSAFQEMPQSDK
jgi:Tol biopolymer transport system component